MSHPPAKIASVRPRRGAIVRGHLDLFEHPNGQPERVPLVVARGRRPGPTLVVSANIHGDELTGMHVIHDLLTTALVRRLRGTLVALPTLNPSGLGARRRQSAFDIRDPNRLFPDPRPGNHAPKRKRTRLVDRLAEEPGAVRHEIAMHAIYDLIAEHADAYLDLHTATTWSIPLTFIDPVFYTRGRGRERSAAQALMKKTKALAQALGLTIVREEPPPRYIDRRMHKTSTGSILNGARLPALTLELGMSQAVDPAAHEAGLRAVRNALRHLRMLDGPPEPQDGVPVVSTTAEMRGIDHPRAPVAGVVRYHVRPGQAVRKGARLATVRRLDGSTARGGVLRAGMDGTVLWLRGEGMTYPGTPLGMFGVEDRLPSILPWPSG